MTIKTQLSEKEFINASLATIWSRPYSKIFLIVFAFIIGVNIFNSASLKTSLIPTFVPLAIFFNALFFVFRYGFKKAYQKNLRASENIEYDFTESFLRITGESFYFRNDLG